MTNELKNEIENKNDIPKGLMSEIRREFKDIEIDLGRSITPTCRTLKAHYTDVSDTVEDMLVVDDPLKPTTKSIKGHPTISYCIRIDNVSEDRVILVRVLKHTTITPIDGVPTHD